MEWCLGMEVKQEDGCILVNQNQYIQQKLIEFDYLLQPNLKRSSPLDSNFQELLHQAETSEEKEDNFPYREIVGSLSYAASGTRPDISTSVSIVSRFLDKPKRIHCDMVRRILYYLRYRPELQLCYTNHSSTQINAFSDASWANAENYASISGHVILIGKNPVSCSSKKQPVVALSSTEAEYIAASATTQEVLWMKQLLEELGFRQQTVPINEDNEGCINLSKNPQDIKITRHIQVRYHFIRDHVKNGNIQLIPCKTQDQLADFLTKRVSGSSLYDILNRLGIKLNSK